MRRLPWLLIPVGLVVGWQLLSAEGEPLVDTGPPTTTVSPPVKRSGPRGSVVPERGFPDVGDDETAAAPPELPPTLDPDASDLREVDVADRAAVAHAALDLALTAFPADHARVDLGAAVAGEPLAVASNCSGAPDYDVTPLYIGLDIAGVVVTDRVGSSRLQLAIAQPLGPAYTGDDASTAHGEFRAQAYPPVGVDDALELAAEALGGEQVRWVGYSYECIDGTPSLQTYFWHNVEVDGHEVLVSAISGDMTRLD